MIEIFKKLAGASRPATAAELQDALASIDEAALATALEAATSSRDEALLSGDEKRLERAEATLAMAHRDLDRGRAATEALTTKIAEAEKRETELAIETERAAIEKLANSVAADLKRVYPRASREIIDLIERLMEAEERVKKFNEKAVQGGYGLYIEEVDPRAFPMPSGIIWHGVAACTSLQPCKGSPGWGAARVSLECAGVKF
ncbi:hypothetical protein W911_06900 [Hyphomicrobium nitrativorans NL23]|uniref:Uncharacterized protein n=1 Tax=Hyphomicrobium nitrativorans NL23 TaxID=1029756 RepID=V5SHQ0_9HYPH|nr:hypothetical protein [Hyphomicrobium nitrativorans]AHB50068.1 hypothetical protein W911_06900 [Hyphomicrobium nitrativorans NL23]